MKFNVGDRVRAEHGGEPYDGLHGTVAELVGSHTYRIAFDGAGTHDVPLGWLDPEPTPEQTRWAVANAAAAGYTFGEAPRSVFSTPFYGWWRATKGGAYGIPVRRSWGYQWSSGLVRSFGHDLPPCPVCGCAVDAQALDRRGGRCFTCAYWLDLHARYEREGVRIVVQRDGERVHMCTDRWGTHSGQHRGFGGAELWFRSIDPTDEQLYMSNDVWFQGEVPERFHHLFPVTHVRVTGAQ